MNLHSIARQATGQWLWLEAYGRSWRFIGHHAWLIEETNPPELIGSTLSEPRFRWNPHTQGIGNLFEHGWVRPLCGTTSRSIRPNASTSSRYSRETCNACQTIASDRGIIVQYEEDALLRNLTYQTIRDEYATWRRNR